jgi:hypothetical protein
LKRFPQGTFFAFSGLFFLLTLLVMFQSEEPFGIAAVIAYFSCLSLTILLLSTPYFASYFINYYRKLHQIEEAILLISEKEGIINPSLPHDLDFNEPPYSAVTVMDERAPGQNAVDDKAEPTDGHPMEPPLNPTDDIIPETGGREGSAQSQLTKKAEKTTEEEDAEAGQLSLLDGMFQSPPTPLKEASAELPVEKESESVRTTIQAYALLDTGCDLYIRGDSPFSWKKGRKMKRLDVGKYELIFDDLNEPVEVNFWVNNRKESLSPRITVEPGVKNECYPEF